MAFAFIRLMLTDKPANMSENVSQGAHDDQSPFTSKTFEEWQAISA